jgi:hypothetical protein
MAFRVLPGTTCSSGLRNDLARASDTARTVPQTCELCIEGQVGASAPAPAHRQAVRRRRVKHADEGAKVDGDHLEVVVGLVVDQVLR